jgi:Tfp pilus assembly protein PilF
VATSLGEKLRMTINPDDVERRNSQRRPAAAAYEAYLKGRFYWNKRTAAGLQMSVQYFNDAIAADSQFALPYVGLADTYALLGSYNALPPRTSMPLARKNADAALALDPTLAEALTSRAFVKFYYDWDWAGAEEDFKRALALNPNYVTARQWYADLLAVRGREREGIEQAQLAAAADPLSLAANGGLGVQFYFDRRTDEAIAQLQKTLALEKDFAPAILSLALALARSDQIPEAISLLKDSMNRLGNLPPLQSLLGNLEARAGNATEARRLLRDLTARREAGREYISAYEIAILYAGLGDRDETFAWLDRSAEEKSVYLVFLPVDPLFEAYRADSRYAALLARLRLN